MSAFQKLVYSVNYVHAAEPLFQKRAAVVQGKEEAPDALGEGEEAEEVNGTAVHLQALMLVIAGCDVACSAGVQWLMSIRGSEDQRLLHAALICSCTQSVCKACYGADFRF